MSGPGRHFRAWLTRLTLVAMLAVQAGSPAPQAQPAGSGARAVPAGPAPETTAGTASETGSTGVTVSTGDLRELVDLLNDDAARQLFVDRLETLIATQETAAGPAPGGVSERLLTQLGKSIGQAAEGFAGAMNTVVNTRAFWRQLRELAADPQGRARWLTMVLKLVLILGPAAVGFVVTRYLLRRKRESFGVPERPDIVARLQGIASRLFFELLPLAVFAGLAFGVMAVSEPQLLTRVIAVSIASATLIIQAVLVVTRAVFVPHQPNLRLFSMRDETAAYIYIWVRRLAYVGGYSFVIADALSLLRFSQVGLAVSRGGGLVFALMCIVLIMQNRTRLQPDSAAAKRDPVRQLGRFFARFWHVMATLYVLGTYAVWAIGFPGGFKFLFLGALQSIVVLVMLRILMQLVDSGVQRGFSVGQRLHSRLPGLERRANRYLPLLNFAAAAALYVGAAVALLAIWQLPAGAWIASAAGQKLTAGLFTIVLILAITAGIWELLCSVIDGYLNATDHKGDPVHRTARQRTLLPLLRNVLLLILVIAAILAILLELGINIAPLLAAAGVIGIAVGFGSQKLVQDVINGLFILLENTISVGDVVEVGGHSGIVESMSIRTITLRDLEGQVHTVPFSAVGTILNKTRDFSFALMDVGIAYREDVSEVMEVLRQLGAELEADPDIGPLILEPLEILGLDEFGDSAIVVKVRLKTEPVMQWKVRRAFNLRMKERFDALGIEIPFPHTTLYFGVDKDGQAPAAPVQLATAPGGDASRPDRPAAAARAGQPVVETVVGAPVSQAGAGQ